MVYKEEPAGFSLRARWVSYVIISMSVQTYPIFYHVDRQPPSFTFTQCHLVTPLNSCKG